MNKMVIVILLAFCAILFTGCKNENKYDWIPKDTSSYYSDSDETLEEKVTYVEDEDGYLDVAELGKLSMFDVSVDDESVELVKYTDEIGENGFRCVLYRLNYNIGLRKGIFSKGYYFPDDYIFFEDEEIECDFLKINNGKIYISRESLTNYFDVADLSEVNRLDKVAAVDLYELVIPMVTTGKIWATDGNRYTTSEIIGSDYKDSFVSTSEENYIPVKSGEQYLFDFYSSWFSQVATILFLDDDGKMIGSYSTQKSENMQGQLITVPQNATKMHLSMFINQKYRIRKKIKTKFNTDSDEKSRILDYLQAKKDKQNIISDRQYKLDKAYVSFVVDDCRPDMDVIADIFEEYNVPLCIGAVYENLYFTASKGEETRWQVCERVVNNGGEVLAHDGDVITLLNIDDFNLVSEQFFIDKLALEQFGFEVNGIILAGGQNYIEGNPKTDIWARGLYKYSDLYGEEKYGEPYFHRRVKLSGVVNNYKSVVNEMIASREWTVFYLHDLQEVDEAKLRAFLSYITSFDSDILEAANYKTVYDIANK